MTLRKLLTGDTQEDKPDNTTINDEYGDEISNASIKVDNVKSPLKLANIRDKELKIPKFIKSKELVDRPFFLLKGRTMESQFPGQPYIWRVLIAMSDTGEIVATIFGQAAVVETLDAIANSDITNRIECTLKYITGGSYGGFYTLE